jgi:glycosyltransferase involved in cell wall biosynthesis
MRILLLTQYFPPEIGAAQNRLSDLAKRLSSAGHEITVLTSMPNYPQGRIFDGYRGRVFLAERRESLRILRTWAYASKHRDFISRLLNYLSFALLAIWTGIRAGNEFDAVVVEVPALFLGVTGILLSRWYCAPMILNVSDLWPKSAVEMGILRNRLAIRVATALENYIYGSSHAIAGQTEGIVSEIRGRVSGVAVELITNGVDPSLFVGMEQTRSNLRMQFGFKDHFVIGYTGLHGLAYDLDSLLDVADRVQKSFPHVLFALFGDGPAKQQCCTQARSKNLINVRFFAPQPAASMPGVYSALDAAIIPLKKLNFFGGTLPSRLFECMAAKLPIILSVVEGEARRIVSRSDAGICVQPEDREAICNAVVQLATNPGLCQKMGESGSRYVCAHYDRREIALRFARLLPRSSGPVLAVEHFTR